MAFKRNRAHSRLIRTKDGALRQIPVSASRYHNVTRRVKHGEIILLEKLLLLIFDLLMYLLRFFARFWRFLIFLGKAFIKWRQSSGRSRGSVLEESDGSTQVDMVANMAMAKVSFTISADDTPEEERAKLGALLDSGSIEGLDAQTIRKLRDLALECQRVNELNDWELKTRLTNIGDQLHQRDAPTVGADTGGDVDDEPVPVATYDEYRLPELDSIFPESPYQTFEFTEEELLEQKRFLEEQLNNFKVHGMVTGIHPGPVITRYEVELAPGEKISRRGLIDGLAMALRAKSVNILVPIPGTSLIGIDVPNRRGQIVYIKEILESRDFRARVGGLSVALGKTAIGEPYIADLTRAPHVLVAGQTGSGKSVCINTIIASLLASKTPEELRMILVDPKLVELAPYRNIPHLLESVITGPEAAMNALRWASTKMSDRYEKLAMCGVRNIKSFNEKVRAGLVRGRACYSQSEEFDLSRFVGGPNRTEELASEIMPYIVIVIDGYDEVAKVGGKDVEAFVAHLADGALKVGIHLVLSVARPSTEIVEGATKANLPFRISFKTINELNSRITLGVAGAEKLFARGDMLCRWPEDEEPIRVHGCFIDDAQCEAIADACAGQNVNYPKVRTFNLDEEGECWAEESEWRDEKFVDAAELVVQLKQASVSLLQRRLGVGYAKAGRIVDQLERAGIVGRERGSKPREVLMNEEELHSFLRSHEATEGL